MSAGRGGRGWLLGVVVVVLIGALVLLGGNDPATPYALDDAGGEGYKGLRMVLERLGTEVVEGDASEVGPALARSGTTVFVPVASASPAARTRRWESFVRNGGRLVLGTPRDGVGPQQVTNFDAAAIVASPPGECDIGELHDLQAVDPAAPTRLEVPATATSCFGDGSLAVVVQQAIGEGTLTTLATPLLFANDVMRPHDQEVDDPKSPMRDNVVLASRLLAPDGGGRVLVVTSGVAAVEVGSSDLFSLIGSSVKAGLWQLAVAFGIYAWWRGRRHGRVVAEPQPVPIAGSELVAAVGNLMARRRDPAHAARLLRVAVIRDLAEHLGVPRGTDATLVAELVAARTGRATVEVLGPLATIPVSTDDDLLRVAAALEVIRTEVLHGRSHPAAVGARSDPRST